MKPFKFPLESLRTLRKQKEQAAQQQYANALAAFNAAEAQVQEAEGKLTESWQLLMREMGAGTSAAKIMGLRAWCVVKEARRNECQSAMDEARRTAESALNEMLLAAREREALDRFCDKAFRAHALAMQREEQKNLDEIAVQRSGFGSLLQMAGQQN